ncbi:hypothetical protein [Paenibacillus piscarius]|uniref:hypothetical protein n=1 Tax=Paenibacillus piscarius TaxID=1089681 RepID=UPI001EE8FA63|nr:hypothetical protein [Paenibacillus piscarius]
MGRMAVFLIEMVRMVVLLVLTLLLLGATEQWLFTMLYGREGFLYTAVPGNVLLFAVMYRNHLQFKGWYRSEQNLKLNPGWTRGLSVTALLLIALPFVIPM